MLQTQDLDISYCIGNNSWHLKKRINLEVTDGELVFIKKPSSFGKCR